MNKKHMPPKKDSFKIVFRILRMLFSFYPVLLPITIVCILLSAVTAAIPALFMQKVLAVIEASLLDGTSWEAASKEILPLVITLAALYVLSAISCRYEL